MAPKSPAKQANGTPSKAVSTKGKQKASAELNPRSKPTEFFGPAGTTVVTFLTPLIAYLLFFGCNGSTGCPSLSVETYKQGFKNNWPSVNGKLWDWQAAAVYFGWYAFTVICWNVLPGDKVEGTVLRDGTRKTYNMNGMWTIVLCLAITAGIVSQPGGIELYTYMYDHWLPLTSAALVNATFQAVFVYVNSFYSGELLALGGNSGVFIYDFFIGRPLNPTWPGFPNFDIKTFNEDRPGLILWPLLNISCLCEQYVKYGRVTDSMWLVVAFQLFYSADCQWFESSMLTQMDITTDGFGYMLSFGDLVWVPFTYGIQARFLAFHPVDLGLPACAAIVALNLAGFYIFRTANSDKDSFRKHGNPKNFDYIETQRGTKLMTSGWWGRSRHPNYFGDWLMALSWCLPTGFNTPITYFYLAFFVVLLLHRQMRDDEACREKYGKDWDRYCKIVPSKIIPYIY